MNPFQSEERRIYDAERDYARHVTSDPKTMFPRQTALPAPGGRLQRKPQASARELLQPTPEDMVEIACDTCGGQGWDPGSLDPFGELCPDCKGSKVELVPLSKIMSQQIPVKEVA